MAMAIMARSRLGFDTGLWPKLFPKLAGARNHSKLLFCGLFVIYAYFKNKYYCI